MKLFTVFLFAFLALGAPREVAGSGADPVRAPGPSALSLAGVLRDVAEGNPTLASRRAMAEAAARRARPAGAWEAPMVELAVENVPTRGGFGADDMTMKSVGIDQRVPLFGANGLRRRAAEEAAGAERAAMLRSRYEILGAAVEAYADASFSRQRVEEAEHHRSTMARFVESARARYRSGNGRLDEILRAEAEEARVRADLAGFQAAAADARALLDALRGRDGEDASAGLEPLPPFEVPGDPASWIAAARDGHPRVLESGARERGYTLSARASRRAVWPDLELRAGYGWREPRPDGSRRSGMFSAGVAFAVPLFAGARGIAESGAMSAMAAAAGHDRREAELDLAREARSLHAEAAAALRMTSLLADTVVSTQERAVEASWSAYAAGATDLWRVFESVHALYGERLQLLDARHALARAQARLVALTGRGDLAGIPIPAMGKDER